MTALAASDITTTIISQRNLASRQKENLVKLVFGDASKTYPSGGIPMPSATALGLKGGLRYLMPVEDRNLTTGTAWKFDYTNSTLRGFHSGNIPPIIYEETVTLTSNAGTLAYLPAYVVMATGTISGTKTPLLNVPHTATVAAGQMTINWTTGAVTTAAADSVSALTVTYIPQQPAGFFAQANMKINEVITLASAGVNTASRAALVSYVYQTAATAAAQTFSHAAGSTNLLIMDVNNSGATTLTSTSNDAKAAVITYLKYAALPNPAYTFIDQASLSLTSQAYTWGLTTTTKGSMMIPGFGNQVINLETTNYTQSKLGVGVTAANGIGKYDMPGQTITTAQTSASTSLPENWWVNMDLRFWPQHLTGEFTINDAPASTTLYAIAVG